MTEMNAKEFWARHRRNPYVEDQEPTLVNRPFWNHFQFAIFFDVIKAKKNLYVDVRSINRNLWTRTLSTLVKLFRCALN